MAVKLYEKDPSKLTSLDEPRPNLSNNSDISDDEDSNQAADIKEEPVDVTTVDENPPLLVPETSQAVWAATAFPTPHLRERHSFSSGQDDPSTDSDTVRGAVKELFFFWEKIWISLIRKNVGQRGQQKKNCFWGGLT